MTLGHCDAFSLGILFVLAAAYGFASLHSTDRADRGHAASVVLDGRDCWLSEAAQLRAGFLLLVPGAVSFLQRIAFDSQCPDLLRPAAGRSARICDRHHYRGPVLVAGAAASHAHGIRGNTRPADEPALEVDGGVVLLRSCSAPDSSPHPLADFGWELR